MYQSHFNFKNPPFRKITRLSGDFLVPYHQDVFNLLKEKSQKAGITGSLATTHISWATSATR
jgi:general secretion pathway protein A